MPNTDRLPAWRSARGCGGVGPDDIGVIELAELQPRCPQAPTGSWVWVNCDPLSGRLRDHHRSLGRPEGDIGVQLPVDLAPSAPQTRPLVSLLPREPSPGVAIGRRDRRSRRDVPGGSATRPARHRPSRSSPSRRGRPIPEVGNDHAVLPARATPHGGEAQGPPAVAPRTPESDPTTGDPIQTSVHRPRETDEPARRKPRPPLGFVRHGAPLSHMASARPQPRSSVLSGLRRAGVDL